MANRRVRLFRRNVKVQAQENSIDNIYYTFILQIGKTNANCMSKESACAQFAFLLPAI